MDDGIQGWDDQELSERAEEAEAIGIEDPQIYIDWCHDCMDASEQATEEKRYLWDECYDAYRARINYPEKEDWQSKMATGEMNATVKQGVAVIRKALRQPNWFSVDPVGQEDQWLANFTRKAFEIWLNPQHGRFNTVFSDANELGFAIGQSHEMIPMWIPGKGLVFSLVPPWQIDRDPDAVPREPWSGDYWIHFEWMDLWKVKQLGQGSSRYVRLDEVTARESDSGKETREAKARRKGQYQKRTAFRNAVKVIEHWGVVLDKQGELLLDNARFTIAGDVLIRNPEPNPFVNIRWPGVSFSPLPDLFAFEGHGIIETSLLLWLNCCSLMSLHMDDLSWRVHKLRQLNRMKLEDPTDIKVHPGKLLLLASDVPANEDVLKEVYTSTSTNETLATLQDWRQLKENTSFVNQFVTGLPGDRSKITKGEVEIKTGQSMNIFDSIGEDIEEGAVNVLKAVREVLFLNWSEYTDPSISRIMEGDPDALRFALLSPDQRREILRADCDIKISGISAIIKNSELIPRYQALLKQAESERFGKYFKPYKLLSNEINALGFYEADFVVTNEQAEAIDLVEQRLQEIQEAAAQIVGGQGGAGGPVAGSEPVPPKTELIEGG